jgi:predicted Zn-dependent protease
MRSLQQSALVRLEAAKGWYLLGNLREANCELDALPATVQTHPDVLEVRFAIYAKAQHWPVCMEISAAMLELAPERPTSWLNSAFTLHRLKQTESAWTSLRNVADRFPHVPSIPYSLACYACCLGRLNESRELLEQAIKLGGRPLREQALQESDLKPLWSALTGI